MFAVVDATGALQSGNATGAGNPATGQFTVTFSGDLGACAVTATAEGAGLVAAISDITVGVSDTTITIDIQTVGGVATDAGFHLIIVC